MTATREAGSSEAWKPDENLIWRSSEEYGHFARTGGTGNAKVALAASAGLVLLVLLLRPVSLMYDGNTWPRTTCVVLQLLFSYLALMIAIAGCYEYVVWRRAFYDRVRLVKAMQVSEAVERLRQPVNGDNVPGAGLTLPNLFVLNRRQLDEYHVISVRQQQLAFKNAQIAAGVGFGTLVAGVILSFKEAPGSSRYVTAGLTALSSLLSGFIAAVFFRSADDTGKQLRAFYEEPSRTGRVLMIERIAALDKASKSDGTQMPDTDLRRLMVEQLLKHVNMGGPAGPSGSDDKSVEPPKS